MTPDERRDLEREHRDEYEEKLRCLGALDPWLRDLGDTFTRVGRQLRRGEFIGDTTSLDRKLAAFPERLQAYREIHERCSVLYDSLRRSGYAASTNGIDYPKR